MHKYEIEQIFFSSPTFYCNKCEVSHFDQTCWTVKNDTGCIIYSTCDKQDAVREKKRLIHINSTKKKELRKLLKEIK
jgi:hypothetical protein